VLYHVWMDATTQTSRAQRIAQVEQELEEALQDLYRAHAVVDAKQRELAALRQDGAPGAQGPRRSLKESVLDVLRRAEGPLSPAEVSTALREAEVEHSYRSIGGTLNSLRKAGLVERVGSKKWTPLT